MVMTRSLQKLTASEVRALLASPDWQEDAELTRRACRPIYRSTDGQGLMLLPTTRPKGGLLFASHRELRSWIDDVDSSEREGPVSPATLLGLDRTFIDRVPEHVERLATVLKRPQFQCDYSVASLERIDRALTRLAYGSLVDPEVVLPLWAYLGELIRRHAGGQWQMHAERRATIPNR
jgi:hypothetical protein